MLSCQLSLCCRDRVVPRSVRFRCSEDSVYLVEHGQNEPCRFILVGLFQFPQRIRTGSRSSQTEGELVCRSPRDRTTAGTIQGYVSRFELATHDHTQLPLYIRSVSKCLGRTSETHSKTLLVKVQRYLNNKFCNFWKVIGYFLESML